MKTKWIKAKLTKRTRNSINAIKIGNIHCTICKSINYIDINEIKTFLS